VFRQVQLMPVGEPGELRGKLVALAVRGDDRHGEAIVERARDYAFDAANMVQIGHHALAGLAGALGAEGDASGRHVDDAARMLGAVLEHEAPIDPDADTLEVASLCTGVEPRRACLSYRRRHQSLCPSPCQ